MSEVETSSSRLRRGAKERNSYGSGGGGQVSARPRTSPSQPSRSPGPGGAKHGHNYNEEDPGIMSEAETSSTRRKPTKAKAVLPVVRTTSKTLERPLGLVMNIIY